MIPLQSELEALSRNELAEIRDWINHRIVMPGSPPGNSTWRKMRVGHHEDYLIASQADLKRIRSSCYNYGENFGQRFSARLVGTNAVRVTRVR